jgi:hypothetical protein
MRCSDEERDAAAAAVHHAVGEGRLTLDEAEDRLERTYRARDREELDALTADLPPAPPPPPARTGWGAVWDALGAQLLVEAATVAGRQPAEPRRRALALLVLLGPLLLILGGSALLLHGAFDGPHPEFLHHGRPLVGA